MVATEYALGRGAVFEPLRGRLFAIAYRMTGTRADAEDIVQEAYLRWHQADVGAVRSPEAWLVSVATRLSIDRLRKAYVEREKYTGPWLPEPIFGDPSPEERLELDSELSLAFVALLERLAPVERAAFLLHDVFDRDYPEIARVLRKSEAACRQVVHRARQRVRSDRRRFRAGEEEYRSLIKKFAEAARAGDEATLLSLFAEDATLTSDGGGVVPAARKVVRGRRHIARLFLVLARKLRGRMAQTILTVNGEPGLVTFLDGAPLTVTSFETDGRTILALYNILNPEKLKGIGEPMHARLS
ncbi:MAG TPA: RNA polymerase sigma-70 factor [Pyrinomonadaceae bacterium]|jgi:RNA polymerase sigma-70 factor (ECF subfamily)|nr:RNA polymerase sigma-70 factor [Pyrinomonadaceae bacterium]